MLDRTKGRLAMVALLTIVLAPSVRLRGAFEDENQSIEVTGRVLDPLGKPIAADVGIAALTGGRVVQTACDKAGVFKLKFTPADIRRPLGRSWREAVLVANAEKHAAAWIPLGQLLREPNPTLRLASDDEPIRAQIVDMDGRPVVGAELKVLHVYRMERGNLDAYLREVRDEPTQVGRFQMSRMVYASAAAIQISGAELNRTKAVNIFRTDKNGRIEIRGVGRERILYVALTAPGIVTEHFTILTRRQIGAKWKRTKLSRTARIEVRSGAKLPVVYASKFTHIASPSQPVAGVVRDHKTGKPIAGIDISVQVRGQQGGGLATTDKDGRYVVHGVPTSGTVSLYAIAPKGMHYINAERSRLEFSAAAPLKDTDFRLVKGVPIRGRLIDSSTGKPVKGRVTYLALTTNEFAEKLPDPVGHYGDSMTDEDGHYEVVALPGLGVLVVNTYDPKYLRASLEGLDVPTTKRGYISSVNLGLVRPEQYDVLQPVTVSAGTKSLKVDLRLKTGLEVRGQVLDVNGKPVHGVVVQGLSSRRRSRKLDSNQFVVSALRPGITRVLVFQHQEKRLGSVIELKGQSSKPITITMRPYATLMGRIVDREGRPVPQATFALMSQGTNAILQARRTGQNTSGRHFEFATGRTDADGRFHITTVVAGQPCEFFGSPAAGPNQRVMPKLLQTLTLRSGEVKDIGNVVLPKAKTPN